MKKLIYLFSLSFIFFNSFGQTIPPDVVATNPVPATGANVNKVSQRYANLTAYRRLYLPRYASNSAYVSGGGKDSTGIYFNTSIGRVVVAKQGSTYDTLSVSAGAIYSAGYGLSLSGNSFRVDSTVIGSKPWVNGRLGSYALDANVVKKTGETSQTIAGALNIKGNVSLDADDYLITHNLNLKKKGKINFYDANNVFSGSMFAQEDNSLWLFNSTSDAASKLKSDGRLYFNNGGSDKKYAIDDDLLDYVKLNPSSPQNGSLNINGNYTSISGSNFMALSPVALNLSHSSGGASLSKDGFGGGGSAGVFSFNRFGINGNDNVSGAGYTLQPSNLQMRKNSTTGLQIIPNGLQTEGTLNIYTLPVLSGTLATLEDISSGYVKLQPVTSPVKQNGLLFVKGVGADFAEIDTLGTNWLLANTSLTTPKIFLNSPPSTDTNPTQILTRDSTTGEVKKAGVNSLKSDTNNIASYVNISAWGDSFIGGAPDPTVEKFPTSLEKEIGVSVINNGYPGYSSTYIKDRFLEKPEQYINATVIWSGKNNANDTAQVMMDIRQMVDSLKSENYVILTVFNSSRPDQYIGTPTYNLIIGLNNNLKARFGSHVIDAREIIVQSYNPALSGDVTAHTGDAPPPSLMSDETHLNTAGNRIVAKYIHEHISLLLRESKKLLAPENLQYIFSKSISQYANLLKSNTYPHAISFGYNGRLSLRVDATDFTNLPVNINGLADQETFQTVTSRSASTTNNINITRTGGDYGLNITNGADADVSIGVTSSGSTYKYGWVQSNITYRDLILNPNNLGQVGIGKVPTTRFDVDGNILGKRLMSVNPSASSELLIGSEATGKTSVLIKTSADTNGYGSIQSIKTGGSEYGNTVISKDGGNTLIATATDNGSGAKLQVNGSATFSGAPTTPTSVIRRDDMGVTDTTTTTAQTTASLNAAYPNAIDNLFTATFTAITGGAMEYKKITGGWSAKSVTILP